MAEIKIGERLIGDGHPTYIVAEVGVNHNGIPQLAFELIDIAVDAGADAVKFQKRNLKNIYLKNIWIMPTGGKKSAIPAPHPATGGVAGKYLLRDRGALPEKRHHFLVLAFDRQSADFLETLGVPAFKVASAD